jgi:Holliday junction resolvasome RuvABC endonuclease subunit
VFNLPNLHDYRINIIGIDPGTTNIGYCCISLNGYTNEVISTYAKTFRGDKLRQYNNNIEHIYGARMARLMAHKQNLINVFNEDMPSIIACESPFFHGARPTAYGPLVEVVQVIKESVLEYNNRIPLTMIEPRLAKKDIGAGLKKEDMREAIIIKKDFFNITDEYISTLDEHSIDACSIAHSVYLKFFNLNERRKK